MFKNLCKASIKAGLFSCCVIGTIKNGKKEIYNFNCEKDSIFDCASITKSMPTGYLALKAIEQGKLDIEDTVANHIPDFAKHHANDEKEAKIFHLLTHSLDYRFPLSTLKNLPPQKIWEKICSHKFETSPGQSFNYGNATSILLGKVVEKIHNKELHEIAKTEVFTPLNMNNTGFNPLEWADVKKIIPTEICHWRKKLLKGEVHDESAYTLQKLWNVGSAGVFSTVPDILKFLEHIQTNKFLLSKVTQNALEHLPNTCTALGFELNNPKFMGKFAGATAFGKTGFTGTSFVCEPQSGKSLVILSNYTYPTRKPNADKINEFRAEAADMFFAAA